MASSSSKEHHEKFLSLDKDGIGQDCEFIVGSQSVDSVVIKGNKFMFSASSEVFKAMFYGDIKEDQTVRIVDLDPKGFEYMKHWIYTGEVDFSSSIHALLTYIAARKYIVPNLERKCIEHIRNKLEPCEVLELYEHCKLLCVSEFDDLCCKIIEEKTDEVLDSKYFESAKFETIEFILKLSTMNLNSESKVFVYFEKWALAEVNCKDISVDKLSSYFNNLKSHIRFLSMSLKEFVSCVEGSLLLTIEEKNAIMVNLVSKNSKPMPEWFSETLHQREYYIISSTVNKSEYTVNFVVSIDYDVSVVCNSHTFNVVPKKFSIRITSTMHSAEYICFHAECLKKDVDNVSIITIGSKLRLQKSNLIFENVCYIIPDCANMKDTQKMIFARLPLTKMKNEALSRGDRSIMKIQASFEITYEYDEE